VQHACAQYAFGVAGDGSKFNRMVWGVVVIVRNNTRTHAVFTMRHWYTIPNGCKIKSISHCYKFEQMSRRVVDVNINNGHIQTYPVKWAPKACSAPPGNLNPWDSTGGARSLYLYERETRKVEEKDVNRFVLFRCEGVSNDVAESDEVSVKEEASKILKIKKLTRIDVEGNDATYNGGGSVRPARW
jgi:hypothetical protein